MTARHARRLLVALLLGGLVGGQAHAAGGRRPRPRRTASRVATSPVIAAAPVAPPARAAQGGPGRVLFVTDQRAYLDRGAREGLKEKQTLQILRAGRPIGSCTVEAVAESQATCTGARLRIGDTFRPARPPTPPAASKIPSLPPVTGVEVLQERADLIAKGSYEKVDFHGKRLFGGHTRVMVGTAVSIWATRSDPDRGDSMEQLDAAIQGYEFGASGLRFDGAFSAMRWSTGSVPGRFRPGTPAQFYLWQAELSRRRPEAGIVFAAGRIWPWHAPGLTLLDGFQVGRHNKAETAEGGLYAGLLPTAVGLVPAADTWAAGLYGSLTQVGGGRGLFRLARQQGRLGVWRGPESGWVGEAEGTGQVWLGPTSVAAGGRVRGGGGTGGRPVVERILLDFATRPTVSFGGGVHLRYFGISPGPVAPLTGEVPTTLGSVHAAANVHLRPWPWLETGVAAGLHQDRTTRRQQRHAAVELRFPRLLAAYGAGALGAELQEGWSRMRVLYAQLVGSFGPAVFVSARLSAAASQFQAPVAADLFELGGQLNLDGAVTSWLRVRAWGTVRAPWLVQGEPPPVPSTGLAGGAGLTGVF